MSAADAAHRFPALLRKPGVGETGRPCPASPIGDFPVANPAGFFPVFPPLLGALKRDFEMQNRIAALAKSKSLKRERREAPFPFLLVFLFLVL